MGIVKYVPKINQHRWNYYETKKQRKKVAVDKRLEAVYTVNPETPNHKCVIYIYKKKKDACKKGEKADESTRQRRSEERSI